MQYLNKYLDLYESCAAVTDSALFSILQCFRHYDVFFSFLDVIITKEIAECPEESVLFRKNSCASKLFSIYSNLVGEKYLKEYIAPLILYIAKDNRCFEVDQSRFDENEFIGDSVLVELEKNRKNLLEASLYILEKILDSINYLSEGLRYCFHMIQKRVACKFPDSFFKSISGFYFLRLLCPILASGDCQRLGLGKFFISF